MEEADDDDDLIDEQEAIEHDQMMEENKDEAVDRVTSHLRQSNNGNPSVAQSSNQGLEGFAGIVGVGFGGKKAGAMPSGISKGKK